ncbi:MAG: hypothetical protein PHH84_03470 [Oscillospiraceae bacterium]|nr:hypothetical protein [Oscillospiraceae bacterium]MDD4414300.1 hypothetical protein [Oscillospiraceae bacterium]
MKKFLSVFIAALLILTLTAPVSATGTPTQKEEAVYGLLASDGSVQSIYVVNSFKGGMITDYGNYNEVSNMTTSEKLNKSGDRITVNSADARFYYQGTLQSKALPWNIDIRYKLDSKEISASELAGKAGALKIAISVTQNKAVNSVFYENYMLQISLTLDTEKCADILSPNATIAGAGKNKVIAHSVLPGKDASITVSANVEDFAMNCIEITAMPLVMMIEMPDTQNLIEDMTSLTDAVSNLNEGVKKLSEGITQSSSGANKLSGGSSDFSDGLSELSGNSNELLNASTQINAALIKIAEALDEGVGESDLGDINALPGGLNQLADGLTSINGGIQQLKDGFASAYSALDLAMSSIPNTDIDPSGLYAAVSGDNALTDTVDRLMAYYASSKTVKGTYGVVQDAFASVAGNLDQMSGSISTIEGTLSGLSTEIERVMSETDIVEKVRQLEEGLFEIAEKYSLFHAGLSEYAGGVNSLAEGYGEVNTGLKSLASGMGELDTGASFLHGGTSKLNEAVNDLPQKTKLEIDEIISQYDKSDFTPVSFVSEKNTSVTAVQFVLKTDPIEIIETIENAVTAPIKLTFWQKLLKLFGLYP